MRNMNDPLLYCMLKSKPSNYSAKNNGNICLSIFVGQLAKMGICLPMYEKIHSLYEFRTDISVNIYTHI